jgi:6-phosphogluconolactonase (cycloisomerase 2 family)
VARFAYVANFGDDTLSILIADNTTGRLRHHGYVQTDDGPADLVIDPSGQFLYTLNSNDQDISLFTVDSLSGNLTAADCNLNTGNRDNCSTGGLAVSLVFEPNGRYAFVGNQLTNTISAFLKDPSTGGLSSVPAQPPVDVTAHGGNTPTRLRVHPDGSYLYVTYEASNNLDVYQIDALDGVLTLVTGAPVASGGTAAVDIAITPDGQYAYVANRSGTIGVFSIDGAGLPVANGAPLTVAGTPQRLAIDSSGQWLYMISKEAAGSLSVFEIQNDGTLAQINCAAALTCPAGDMPESLAIDPTGQFVSVANRDGDTLNIFTIDHNNGQLTALAELAARNAPAALAYYTDTAEVTVTPRFAYVINSGGNSVSPFTINSSNGGLTAIGSPVTTGTNPSAIAADLGGRFAYATVNLSVYAYGINAGTGALSQISGSPFAIDVGSFGAESLSVDPSGRFLYVADTASNTLSAFGIDNASGALTLLGGSPVSSSDPIAITVDPTGRFAYVASTSPSNSVSAFAIDPLSGNLTAIGAPLAAGSAPNSVAVDPSGRFVYVANVGIASYNISAYRIDPLSGALSEITGSPFDAGSAPFSIAVDPLGEFLYVANQSSQDVTPYSIDQTTGALTAGTSVSTELNPQSITVDASGRYVYVANYGSNSVSGYSINSSSGALSSTGASAATGLTPRAITTTATVQ